MISYRKRYVKTNISRVGPRRPLFLRFGFWLTILILIVITATLYLLIFHPTFQIENILIFGNDRIEKKDLENLILKNINKRILAIGGFSQFWEFNSKSIFLANSEKIKKQILKEFPGIEEVEVVKIFNHTIEVKVKERIPAAIFCYLDKSGAENEENCFFIDKNGVAFEQLFLMPQNMVVIRQSQKIERITIGKEAVNKNIMDLVLKLEENLKKNFQIRPIEAVLASPLRVNIKTSEGWKIYLDTKPKTEEDSEIEKLMLLLKNEINAEQRKNLRYIDLRPKNKAVICDNKICGGG